MVRSRSDHSEPSEPSSPTANHPTSPSYTDAHPVRAVQTGETDCTPDSEDPERPDAARAPSAPGHEANAPPPDEEVTKLRLTAHYAGLVLASMIGCLIRLGLDALGDYDGRIIFPLAWSQGVGCAIMGMSMGLKNDITAIYPPLYTFLTTGIAGSVTTFSSFTLEGYSSFSNQSHYPRSGFYDSTDGFAYSFSTYLIALGGLHIGTHLSEIASPLLARTTGRRQARARAQATQRPLSSKEGTSTPPTSSRTRHAAPILDVLTITSAALSYLVALLLYFFAPAPWRHRATFPILLAPPGAILRFVLSKFNPRGPFVDRFPIGTFAANMLATLIISGMYAAQRVGEVGVTRCDALYAVQQGFCGCLSTVSTFVVESRSIRRKRWKWTYVGLSVVLGHVFVLAIVGGVGWTEGYGPVCTGSD